MSRMLPTKHLLAALLAPLALLPSVAVAYVTPEEVLQSYPQDITTSPQTHPAAGSAVGQTPNSRRAQAAAVTDTNQQRVDAAKAFWYGSSSSSVASESSSEDLPPAATQSSSAGGTVTLSIDAATLRTLERIERNRQAQQVVREQPDQQVLHGGAPLAPSGPAGILTALAKLGAIAWTMWRLKKTERC